MSMKKNQTTVQPDFVFGKINYTLLIVALGIIIIGFLLMMGGGSDDPNVFNKEEIYSFRRITLAPIVVLLGYAFGIYAIMKKSEE